MVILVNTRLKHFETLEMETLRNYHIFIYLVDLGNFTSSVPIVILPIEFIFSLVSDTRNTLVNGIPTKITMPLYLYENFVRCDVISDDVVGNVMADINQEVTQNSLFFSGFWTYKSTLNVLKGTLCENNSYIIDIYQ